MVEMGFVRRRPVWVGLRGVVEAEFEVGRPLKERVGGTLFAWNPEKREFEWLKAPVEWVEMSRRGVLGKAKVSVPEGSVLKYVRYTRGGTATEYYLATPEGLKPVEAEVAKRVVREFDGIQLAARCNVLKGVEGVEDCLYYVSGLGTPVGAGAAAYFKPTWSREEAESYIPRLELLGEALREIRERVKGAAGVEPTRLVDVEFPLETRQARRPGSVCLSFPFLGREKFREIAGRFKYDDIDKCFWVPEEVVGSDVFEKLKKALLKTAYLSRGP